MFCITACVLLYAVAVGAQTAEIPTVAPVPTTFPFNPTSNPLLSGYANPYYNQYKGAAIPIITYSNEHAGDGTYSFSFSTADGKQAQENGYLKDAYIDNTGDPQGTQVVQGSYSYVSPEGTPIQVSYVADENGFRPSGVHIPADGKAVIPAIADLKDRQNIFDPYSRYNSLNYRNRAFGQYNRPYDSRYPYNNNLNRYNPYNNNYNPYLFNKAVNQEAKKNTA